MSYLYQNVQAALFHKMKVNVFLLGEFNWELCQKFPHQKQQQKTPHKYSRHFQAVKENLSAEFDGCWTSLDLNTLWS